MPAYTSPIPLLYRTRTFRKLLWSTSAPARTRWLHASSPRLRWSSKGDDPVPFELAPDQLRDNKPTKKNLGNSTITYTEQRVFEEIFNDINKRRQEQWEGSNRQVPPKLPTKGRRGATRARVEATEATEATEDHSDQSADYEVAGRAESTREKILNMYPPSLRRAAETALGLQQEASTGVPPEAGPEAGLEASLEDTSEVPITNRGGAPSLEALEPKATRKARIAKTRHAVQLLEFRKRETQRMLKLMRQTKSDLDLWDLLDEQVFSMVKRLGIAEPKLVKKENLGKKPKLDMEKWGPLYSVHLLNGLRCLDRNFATSSPLALNMLPRINELGMASYVLGVSTIFYNELMSIYWHRYGDLPAVMRLLAEMEKSGMGGDGDTVELIDTVLAFAESLSDPQHNNPFAGVIKATTLYDPDVTQRLQNLKKWAETSIIERADSLVWY